MWGGWVSADALTEVTSVQLGAYMDPGSQLIEVWHIDELGDLSKPIALVGTFSWPSKTITTVDVTVVNADALGSEETNGIETSVSFGRTRLGAPT